MKRQVPISWMNSKLEHSSHAAPQFSNRLKYGIGLLSVVAGLFVWFWFDDALRAQQLGLAPTVAILVRLGTVILTFGVAIVLWWSTEKGRLLRLFLVESRFELRKVIWLDPQESLRLTMVVIVVVGILSLLLGGFDFIIQKLTQWFLSR